MHRRWLCLVAAAAAAAMAGCDIEDWGDSNRYQEDFHQSQALKSGGRLYVETFNGSIEVTGWDQETVDISGTKYASTRENLNALKIDVVATGDSVRIRTVRPSERRGNMGARYVIKVPRRTALERLETSNGGVRVEDIEGPVRLRTSNGGLRLIRVRGDVEATTSNGGVELSDVEGRTVVKTSNGGIRAGQVRGSLSAHTSNGSIRAELKDTEPGRPVRLSSSNGSIELSLDRLENDVEAVTTNSSITVRLPAAVAATLKARTTNSSISSDFEVTARGEFSKNRLEGSIGGGGRLLDLSTTNGSIRLVKL